MRRWRRGSAKAAVFPVPVGASASTSLPDRRSGIASLWIGVGSSYPRPARVVISRWSSASFVNPSLLTAVVASVIRSELSDRDAKRGPAPPRRPSQVSTDVCGLLRGCHRERAREGLRRNDQPAANLDRPLARRKPGIGHHGIRRRGNRYLFVVHVTV